MKSGFCEQHGEEKVKSRCKRCRADYMRKYIQERRDRDPAFREAARIRSSQWSKDNPVRRREAAIKHRLRKFGITRKEYDILYASLGGACAICGGVEKRDLCIDHDHDTGVVRGLLCTRCNLGIGLIESPEKLAAAQTYLASPPFQNL